MACGILPDQGLNLCSLHCKWILYHWTTREVRTYILVQGLPQCYYSAMCLCSVLGCVQLFATPLDCSSPGSSVHGMSQARILGWVAISFSRGSSQPKDWTNISCISCTGMQILCHCAIWEALITQPSTGNLPEVALPAVSPIWVMAIYMTLTIQGIMVVCLKAWPPVLGLSLERSNALTISFSFQNSFRLEICMDLHSIFLLSNQSFFMNLTLSRP